ncbi:Intracellular endo-alpha-(1-_5)-L-arabinanase [Posidoniimonas polymericola]|uniref:Intracellular endo-alpha-(1->5)-L-arabinanase n=1 Tax=Posidoniimonas polymericola TaxID=2528002 RepID=A0A5C5YLA0_9BACT|nr:arabinan endo-1,5-alpha-L-arabinosidase [Posidoniimonas polymericola]TWT75652.1 Intracellular endo-alpha-(1->5)-L-arabinanase [Posidoniimonas polymericola]
MHWAPGCCVLACCAAAAADEAVLSGHVRVHDPSSIVREGGHWRLFSTGWGVQSLTSPDLENWTSGPGVFAQESRPAWIPELVPGFRGHYWAPDIVRVGDEYRLYYSASQFGKQNSGIGLVATRSLDPESKDYSWVDRGAVVTSNPDAPYNAIDPSVLVDDDGRHWMAFGSYWQGLYLVELDPATGLSLKGADKTRLAWAEMIEAPTLIKRDGVYFLFVNHGLCCRGVESTYRILVGRSEAVTGPYLDRDGTPLLEGGGTLVLETLGRRIGPGHVAMVQDGEQRRFGFHYYDRDDRGRSKLGLAEFAWSDDNWPQATNVQLVANDTTPRRPRRRPPQPAASSSGPNPPEP